MKRLPRGWPIFFVLAGVFACQSRQSPLNPEVEVGVFFGGQIQRVTSLEVSAVTPPHFGFRVTFPPPEDEQSAASKVISYEVVRPGPLGRRVTEEGQLQVPAEQTQLDHVVALPDDAKMGVWNVRVVWNELVLADRAIYLARPN